MHDGQDTDHSISSFIPEEHRLRVFRYVINHPVNAAAVGFAVGPFQLVVPPSQPRLTYFCLPEMMSKLAHTTRETASILPFYEAYLEATYPFATYSQVFVADPPTAVQGLAGMSLLDQSYCHDATVVDVDGVAHLKQVEGFITSWLSAGLMFASTKDAWFLVGLIQHCVARVNA